MNCRLENEENRDDFGEALVLKIKKRNLMEQFRKLFFLKFFNVYVVFHYDQEKEQTILIKATRKLNYNKCSN